MRLGVFDSGIGGRAVAESLQRDFLEAEIIVVDDHTHVPYGDRTAEDIIKLTDAAIQPLLGARCDVIVIACNSATAAAIETLRDRYPQQKFIGLEPMVKPAAALTKSGIISICATPATLNSERYKRLKDSYANGTTILEPDCHNWAKMIEDNTVNERQISETIETALEKGADVIVLACTHYHWIRELIEKTAENRAAVMDPSEAIARRVKSLLESS